MPNDRITYFECKYDLINNAAIADATFNSTTASSYSDINTLTDDPVSYSYMFTTEHNYSVLNGSQDEFTETFKTAYMSSEMSDGNGGFSTNPSISISFTQPQNCYGLTFYFEEDYPIELKVSMVNDQGRTIEYVINPDSLTYVADIELISCVSMNIEFIRTAPYRYIKLSSLTFGRQLLWSENDVNQGKLLLEKDPIGDKISINTLTMDVIDKQNDYNIANDSGLHLYFQKRQVANAYEYINGDKLFLGRYFLDNFSWNENLVNLKCVSYIGLLDNVQYYEGDIYNGTLAGTLLDDIFRVAGIDEYTIDTETYNTSVYGTLKPSSCRDALRQILFACNSTVDTTGTEGISIYKSYNYMTGILYRSDKISTKITKNDYVHGVNVEYANYTLNLNSIEEIVKDELYTAGEHTVIFTEAYDNITIKQSNSTTVITPTTVKPYYVTFTLSSDTQITITGNKYEEYNLIASATNKYIEAGETDTVETYTTTLCNTKMATEKAALILDYLQYRLTIDVETITDSIRMSGRKLIQNPNPGYADFIAWYTSREFDLTGSFVDSAKLIGYYQYENSVYYADSELYAGEGVGIL